MEVSVKQVQSVKDILKRFNFIEDGSEELAESLATLLAMPDAQFAILAPTVYDSFTNSLNMPVNRINLARGINASGMESTEIVKVFLDLIDEVNKLPISVQKRDFLIQILETYSNTINELEGIEKRIIAVPIELCDEAARIPDYAHIGDSGMDVYAIEDVTIKPGETALVRTGLKIALPVGYELQVRPKSGRALKTKMRVANTPGTIDQGYRDEICVIVDNIEPPIKDITYRFIRGESDHEHDYLEIESIKYGSDLTIGKGEKFCQLVLATVPKVDFYQVESVMEMGENRNGGFGSTSIYSADDIRYMSDVVKNS